MRDLLEIIKLTIPALAVFATVYFVLKQFLNRELELNEQQLRLKREELKMQERKEYIPLRNQAYERAVLYLERIDPNNIIMRIHKPGMSARQLHVSLLKAIRDEYNHNMVQQLYVSKASWDKLKQAKEETVKIVNMAQNEVEETASGFDLSKVIFEIVAKLDKLPTTVAIDYIKTEFQKSIR